jgi:hypothetical protein
MPRGRDSSPHPNLQIKAPEGWAGAKCDNRVRHGLRLRQRFVWRERGAGPLQRAALARARFCDSVRPPAERGAVDFIDEGRGILLGCWMLILNRFAQYFDVIPRIGPKRCWAQRSPWRCTRARPAGPPASKRNRFCMPRSSIPAYIGVQFQGARFDVVQHAELILGGILGHRAEKFTVCLHEL